MCGICGVVHTDGQIIHRRQLETMNQELHHRGPDGEGYFVSENVGLGMRRLSIIDLAGSDQPLYNTDKSVVLVFNGEIFNYQDLRTQLQAKGYRFRTDGDGETIAHLYTDCGLGMLDHLRGQFAIALWDSRENKLVLARDRMGQKPLYYYQQDNCFVFGSEIKAILAHPQVLKESALDDPEILALYLGYGYIPAPLTAFRHIHALLPGEVLTLHEGQIHKRRYWTPPTITDATISENQPIDTTVESVHDLLREAVRLRLIADVPLGAFLSGGLDSSLIVAMMKKLSNASVKTFSIGFAGDDSFDETRYAKQVADLLETDHIAFTVEPNALDLLDQLVWHHDQPFADSSAIPTFLVSQLTRQEVTVALTGDGGDELYAGYERFVALEMVRRLGIVPRPLWGGLATILRWFPEGTGYYNGIKRARRFAQGAKQPLANAYFDWVRVFSEDFISQLTTQTDHAGEHFTSQIVDANLASILYVNMTNYLPDDLLIKADRCSMMASLEARAPFLDHHLVEQASLIPINLKLRGRTTKYILKQVAERYLPHEIIHRQKHGFGVPMGTWLKRDIQPVRDILLSESAKQPGLLDMRVVSQLIDEHQAGKHDHGGQLWTLLTLQTWHHKFTDN